MKKMCIKSEFKEIFLQQIVEVVTILKIFIGITLKFLWNFSGIILGNFSEIPLIFHWNFFGTPKKFQ